MIRLINRLKNSSWQMLSRISPFNNLHDASTLTHKLSKKNLAWSAGLLALVAPIAFAYGWSGQHGTAQASRTDSTSSNVSGHVAKVSQPKVQDAVPAEPAASNNSTSSSHTQISVNGQNIEVPENGNVHQTMTDGNSHTTVDVNSSNTSSAGSGAAVNKSSTTMNISSHSSDNTNTTEVITGQ
jgi:hypothetical protein